MSRASARGHRLVQPGPVSVGSGQAVVDVEALRRDAQRGEGVTLSGEAQCAGWHPFTGTVHRTSLTALPVLDVHATGR